MDNEPANQLVWPYFRPSVGRPRFISYAKVDKAPGYTVTNLSTFRELLAPGYLSLCYTVANSSAFRELLAPGYLCLCYTVANLSTFRELLAPGYSFLFLVIANDGANHLIISSHVERNRPKRMVLSRWLNYVAKK